MSAIRALGQYTIACYHLSPTFYETFGEVIFFKQINFLPSYT